MIIIQITSTIIYLASQYKIEMVVFN